MTDALIASSPFRRSTLPVARTSATHSKALPTATPVTGFIPPTSATSSSASTSIFDQINENNNTSSPLFMLPVHHNPHSQSQALSSSSSSSSSDPAAAYAAQNQLIGAAQQQLQRLRNLSENRLNTTGDCTVGGTSVRQSSSSSQSRNSLNFPTSLTPTQSKRNEGIITPPIASLLQQHNNHQSSMHSDYTAGSASFGYPPNSTKTSQNATAIRSSQASYSKENMISSNNPLTIGNTKSSSTSSLSAVFKQSQAAQQSSHGMSTPQTSHSNSQHAFSMQMPPVQSSTSGVYQNSTRNNQSLSPNEKHTASNNSQQHQQQSFSNVLNSSWKVNITPSKSAESNMLTSGLSHSNSSANKLPISLTASGVNGSSSAHANTSKKTTYQGYIQQQQLQQPVASKIIPITTSTSRGTSVSQQPQPPMDEVKRLKMEIEQFKSREIKYLVRIATLEKDMKKLTEESSNKQEASNKSCTSKGSSLMRVSTEEQQQQQQQSQDLSTSTSCTTCKNQQQNSSYNKYKVKYSQLRDQHKELLIQCVQKERDNAEIKSEAHAIRALLHKQSQNQNNEEPSEMTQPSFMKALCLSQK